MHSLWHITSVETSCNEQKFELSILITILITFPVRGTGRGAAGCRTSNGNGLTTMTTNGSGLRTMSVAEAAHEHVSCKSMLLAPM
jgi:hypothetical protein